MASSKAHDDESKEVKQYERPGTPTPDSASNTVFQTFVLADDDANGEFHVVEEQLMDICVCGGCIYTCTCMPFEVIQHALTVPMFTFDTSSTATTVSYDSAADLSESDCGSPCTILSNRLL